MKVRLLIITIGQIAFLWILSLIGDTVQRFSGIPIPGSILSMVLLFLLLLKGWIKLEWIAFGSEFLLKYLALFYIPIAVGIMDSFTLFRHEGIQILIVIFGSTIFGLLVVGRIAQTISRAKGAGKCTP